MTTYILGNVIVFGFRVLLLCISMGDLPADRQLLDPDSDQDGLSDRLEQALLIQFAPHFLIGEGDCSRVPAEFRPGVLTPVPEAHNGTVYGQVSPVTVTSNRQPMAEIHFFHLWKQDCGARPHWLDAEHVSVLIRASGSDPATSTWTALYWYAAAHEQTVCDVSQIARAATLNAETHGAKIWVSPGKHASYLNEKLCERGCGSDRCEKMVSLPSGKLINLGELKHTMNGSLFVSSSQWPLAGKMAIRNFPADSLARLNQLPVTEIAWANAGRHPAQGVIAISSTTGQAIAGSGEDAVTAIAFAGSTTSEALQTSYRHTRRALGISVRHIGKAIRIAR